MGKKKNKARQLALNATPAQNQPQSLSNLPQPCPNGSAYTAVAPNAGASIAVQPKKRRRLTKAERKQRRVEQGIDREAQSLKQEAEDLRRDTESQQALDLNGQPLASATTFFSTAPSSQDTKPSRQSQRKARNNSFVGDALLNVLDEVQGKEFSLPHNAMPASARNGLAMDGSNDQRMSEHDMSVPGAAQERAQDASMHPYNFAPGTMPTPASTLPQSTPGASYGYDMANAMWDWNNAYGAGLREEQTAQTIAYHYQTPALHSQDPGSIAAAWGQASALPHGFPRASAMGQFAYANPAWQLQGQLGPGGLPPWVSAHQRRTMEPTHYRGFATDTQTPPWRGNADPNGQSIATSRSMSPGKSPRSERPNKPGPPRPKPSAQYLAQSLKESHHLTVPQHLLIVIDLNGTLLFRPKASKSSNFIRRPFTRPFISYLFANHTIMVWSSARPENVNRMCTGLFSPAERQQLKAEWGRDMLGLTAKQYNDKVQVFKELRKVWEAADVQQWHPMHNQGARFDQRNTLLIDDSVDKAASEPYNLVEVDDFEAKEGQMSRDVLREVAGYLEDAKLQTDVSAWCRAGNRFAYGKGWGREWQEETDVPSTSSGRLDDVVLPSPAPPLNSTYFAHEGGVRLTRSQRQSMMMQPEPGALSVLSGQQGGAGLVPVPTSTGDAAQPSGGKLTRGERRRLRQQQKHRNPA